MWPLAEYPVAAVVECSISSELLAQGKFPGVTGVPPYLFELLAPDNEQILFPNCYGDQQGTRNYSSAL